MRRGPREAQQRCADGADGDRHVQPAQEGALVSKEGLWLDLHGDSGRHCGLLRRRAPREPPA